jgi:hypothetical protein
MDAFKNVSKEELYYALTQLIEGPDTILDQYGRHGRLINRDKYYVFQPLEITNPNVSLYESKIPVKTMNEHVRYMTDENIKTPVFGSEEKKLDEHYESLIAKMRENLETATKHTANDLKDKNEDWYFNLNSIKCKKDSEYEEINKKHKIVKADTDEIIKDKISPMRLEEYTKIKNKWKKDAENEKKFLELKKTKKIANDDTDEMIRSKISPMLLEEYKQLEREAICTTQGFFSVATRLTILGIDAAALKRYVSDHIIETLSHENRLILAKEVLKRDFAPSDDLERRVVDYFRFLLLDGGKTLVLAKDDENIYYNISDWSELSFGEKNQLTIEMRIKMGIPEYSDIIGFVGNFSSKDMVSAMVFRTKNMTQKRNNKSAFLQNDSKIAIIKQINTILKLASLEYSFDDETCSKCERNTDDISKIAVACIFEMLIRKFNEEKTKQKTWLLTPEQAIFNNIKNA